MIVLIEGCDGTGKTTLANELVSYGYDYHHFVVPDKPVMRYWFEKLQTLTQPTVLDRLHLSEEAYGPVFRDGSALSELDWWVVEGWLWARDTVLILCSTSWANMEENQRVSKGEYHGDRQRAVVLNYMDLLGKTDLPMTLYDYTGGDVVHTLAMSLVKERQARSRVRWERTGLGAIQGPRTWLVGDRPSPQAVKEPELSQTVFHSTAGEYLRRAMAGSYERLAWHNTHLSNAYDGRGMALPLYDDWNWLGRPKVVALGNLASKALEGAGIPNEKVPHPQWWRRFRHHDLKEYTDELTRAAGLDLDERPVPSSVAPGPDLGRGVVA